MPLYNTDYLRNLARSRASVINEARQNIALRTKTSFDIFLAHSLADQQDVYGLYIDLTDQGFSVYVDWIIDSHLERSNVTRATAEIIRGRLRSSKSLLLAMSTNAVLSKWIPWELGYVDGHTQNCALVPVAEGSTTRTSFEGREFLSLYPYITRTPNRDGKDKRWVVESADTFVIADEWVSMAKKPFKRDDRTS